MMYDVHGISCSASDLGAPTREEQGAQWWSLASQHVTYLLHHHLSGSEVLPGRLGA